MARNVRIFILLLVLLFVSVGTWMDQAYTTNWKAPLLVALYPIDADGSEVTSSYLDKLQLEDFDQIEAFFDEERREYDVALEQPIKFVLAPRLLEKPPALPEHRSMLSTIWWSLKLRAWSKFSVDKPPGPTPRIRMYLLFHDPNRTPMLGHSTGLQKGLVGVVNLFADKKMNGSNNVIVAHEVLHTLGATDKYDLANNQPLYPIGYAEPKREPLLPQSYAELMAGRIPLAANQAAIPESLSQVIVGPATAVEIGWMR